ncbi:MBOAT-domain-containing protein [Hesseltinella vesiculosa]|uniref:MBOAT-domain-containing protein n=1 Tax=Hesseltinella vesiculosa TaxID=101127 RepID=A0A1X2GG15_9FUNG|nr:MBOAT-domain-containing protein [Hesseltinella vesiculosa]
MDAFFVRLANLAGDQVQPDHLKLVFSLLSAYPAAYLHRSLPNAYLKHWFSICFTCFLMVKVLASWQGFCHIVGTSLFTYAFMRFYHGPHGPWINFALVMLSLSACHLDRQWRGVQGDATLDYSGAMMVSIMKLSSFGFNVLDGRKPANVLTPAQERMKVQTYPSPLAYFGWILFFPGFLVGPTCEFMDYMRLLTLPLHDTATDPLTPQQKATPLSCRRPLLVTLARVTLFLLGLIFLHPIFNYDAVLTYPFQGYTPLHRFLFVQLAGTFTRFRFYVAWLLSEGPCMISGIGFNGFDKANQPRWDRVTPVAVSVEWSPNLAVCVSRWNMAGNRWLKSYVYVRVAPLVGKSKAGLITYAISAVWHGFLPGYYIYMFSIGILQALGVLMRKTVRPLCLTADTNQPLPFWKSAYDLLSVLFTMTCVNTLSAGFMLCNWDKNITALQAVYFYPYHVFWVGLAFWLATKGRLRKWQKRRLVTTATDVDDLAVGQSKKAKAL